jgi:hypothetical protein
MGAVLAGVANANFLAAARAAGLNATAATAATAAAKRDAYRAALEKGGTYSFAS